MTAGAQITWSLATAGALLLPRYGTPTAYVARGCRYVVEWYDDDRERWGTVSLVIYAYGRDGGPSIWSGSAICGPGDTMIETVRAAREASRTP